MEDLTRPEIGQDGDSEEVCVRLVKEQLAAVAYVKRNVASRGESQHTLIFLLRGLQKDLRRERMNGLTQTQIDNVFNYNSAIF